jgi:hypothetical protein
MWKEQLKNIKKELNVNSDSESKPKIIFKPTSRLPVDKVEKDKPSERIHNTSKPKPKKKNKPKQKLKKNYVDHIQYLLIGRSTPLTSVVAVKSASKYKLELGLEKLSSPSREVCSSFLDQEFEQDLKLNFPKVKSIDKDGDSQELVIGLDFGTAFTKVVVGEITYAHAISFGEYGNLLPSKLFVNSEGECFLSAELGEHVLTDLKLPLLLENSTEVDHVAIVSFIALVFLECRHWSEQSIYKDFSIDWLVNVGLPTESYHDEKLSKLYRQLINAAWVASFCDVISLKLADVAIKELQHEPNTIPAEYILSHDVINLFPEFAAQIVGYVQSPSRREYSHLLVDVGAGTLDVAMFIVKNDDGEWLFETTGKDINALGADILLKHRILNGKLNAEVGIPNLLLNDEAIAKAIGVSLLELLEIDKPFARAVSSSLSKVVNSVAGGYKFYDAITTFICGGGSHVELYKKQIAVINNNYPLKILSIPVPERLRSEGVTLANYHRLSVAYGLSFDPFDIGVVTQKRVDIKPQQRKEYEPSQYLLCPK